MRDAIPLSKADLIHLCSNPSFLRVVKNLTPPAMVVSPKALVHSEMPHLNLLSGEDLFQLLEMLLAENLLSAHQSLHTLPRAAHIQQLTETVG